MIKFWEEWKQLLLDLAPIQKELDNAICSKMEIDYNSTEYAVSMGIAFKVELGEFANEHRAFKIWSSTKDIIKNPTALLEEFIDVIHFHLNIMNRLDIKAFDDAPYKPTKETDYQDNTIINSLSELFDLPMIDTVDWEIASMLLAIIANRLNYSVDTVRKAYMSKNQVNYKRQEENY